MLTRKKLERAEGKLKSFDPKAGHAPQRQNMVD